MSGPVAAHVLEDPAGFARAGGQREGELAIASFSRLQDSLADTAGHVGYTLRGGQDSRQRPMLELEVAGSLSLHCALCTEPLVYRLALSSRVLIAQPGEVPADDDDPESPEWIEAGPVLDLAALVEDEILLGLPLSVRHEQGGCGVTRADGTGAKTRDSPFAGLAGLLAPGRRNKD